jgi:hypothetical protein
MEVVMDVAVEVMVTVVDIGMTIEVDCPQSLSVLSPTSVLVASLYLEWLIGVEVSIANRSRSSQARRDSSRTNRIPPRGWAGGSEKNQVSLSSER